MNDHKMKIDSNVLNLFLLKVHLCTSNFKIVRTTKKLNRFEFIVSLRIWISFFKINID